MTDAISFESPSPQQPEFVASDISCRKCQYNLRGLAMDSRCPECGTPVGLSLRGDLLCYSDPAWVDTLRSGVSLILWSVVVSIFAMVIGALTARAGGHSLPALVGSLAAYLLELAGAWMLTTPDPGGIGEDRYGTSRKLIRITLLVGVLSPMMNIVEQTAVLPPGSALLTSIMTAIVSLIGVVGTFATLNYLSKLAQRIPDEKLAKRARGLMWGFGIPLGILVVLGLGMRLLGRVAMSGGPMAVPFAALGCCAFVCAIMLLVYGILYLLMLGRFKQQLQVQADTARRTWAVDRK